MRPQTYRDHLVDLLQRSPGVQGAKVLENGPHPYALSMTVGGRERRWQVIGQLADGAKHDPVTPPVENGPPTFVEVSLDAAPDAWLAGVIGASEPADTERLDVWSARDRSPGVTVHFHNGERAFVRLV
jgi:hypothetical protein